MIVWICLIALINHVILESGKSRSLAARTTTRFLFRKKHFIKSYSEEKNGTGDQCHDDNQLYIHFLANKKQSY